MIDVTDEALRTLKGPNQIAGEWKTYLQFLQNYCKQFGIVNPIVVEIGTQYGHQKKHYEKFLDAVHIGIDVSDKYSKPDILGDSHNPSTITVLKKLLNGRSLNFLFIDGNHTYLDAIADYYAYGPLTTDIIAFHDIRHEKEIGRLWADLQTAEKENPGLTFLSIGAWGNGWCELGIGLIVKRNKADLMGDKDG